MRKDRFQDRHDRVVEVEQFSPSESAGGATITRYILPKLINPNALDNQQVIWEVTPGALTISKISVTLDIDTEEVAGDLKYADDFISLANPVVINAFDTTSGVLSDDSITQGAVPAGKALYLSFDSAPSANIKQMLITITFTFD